MLESNQSTTLVVKRTFLEFVNGVGAPARKRSMSDTWVDLFCGSVKSNDVEDAASDVSTNMPADTVSEDGKGSDALRLTVVSQNMVVEEVQSLQWADEHCECADNVDKTTVMFRNVPNDYTRSMFIAMLENEGFREKFNFVYLPIDFSSKSGFGYAFINLVCPQVAEKFRVHFDGFSRWTLPSNKVAEVTWSDPSQGLATHVERYRNSPVMHEAVPDEFRPVMLEKGLRVPFPPPTKAIKMPRIRQSTKRQEAFRGRRTH